MTEDEINPQTVRLDKLADAESVDTAHSGQSDNPPNLDMLLDIPVTISVEIGRAHKTVREFLRLAKGAVVELDKPVGDALEVFVNGKLVAKGEAVVVNERFAIRLTEVVSAGERAQRLR